jgi:hypothetical protein
LRKSLCELQDWQQAFCRRRFEYADRLTLADLFAADPRFDIRHIFKAHRRLLRELILGAKTGCAPLKLRGL